MVEWHNGFEHDPEEATRVRVRLLRELAANREALVSTHMPIEPAGQRSRNASIDRNWAHYRSVCTEKPVLSG
jgi:hypothetical protein